MTELSCQLRMLEPDLTMTITRHATLNSIQCVTGS